MNKIFRYISFLLLIVGVSTTASARSKRSTFNTYGRESSGMNGFDYKLQKPLGNDTFPSDEKGFWKHAYIGAGVGVSALGNTLSYIPKPGFRFNGQVGGWFTPVHGLRILGKGGILSVHKGTERSWFGGGQVDYMLNLSYLLRGYNPYRKFELIGTVGLEADVLRFNGAWGKEYGIGSSLQMRFNVAPSLFLFIEPRIAVQTGTRYDGTHDQYRIKADGSLSVGLGYRVLTGKYRSFGATDFDQKDDDNLYFGVSAGTWFSPRDINGFSDLTTVNPIGSFYAGKMFSSTSGLQLTAAGGTKKGNHRFFRSYFAFGTLDYVLNLDNAFGGYRPNQVFNLLVNIGVGGGISRRNLINQFSPVFSAGLTGQFRVSPNWAITLHPQVYAAKTEFFNRLASKRPAVVSVDLGLRYTIGDFTRRYPESEEAYAEGKHWFITAGAGIGKRFRKDFGLGSDVFVGFGKRFTPVSSWRAMLSGAVYPKSPCAIDFTAGLDYLSSITTAMCGYDPDRLFELQMVAGVFGGLANYDGPTIKTFGGKLGLHGNFRINEHLDLYIEPQVLLSRLPIEQRQHGWIPTARVNLGLRYRLGTPDGQRGHMSETLYGNNPYFVSLSAGPAIHTGATYKDNMNICGAFDIQAGRWFSMVSGARISVSNDWAKLFDNETTYLGSLHADYLLNATSLLDRRSSRKFHIIGAAGVGLAYGRNGHKPYSFAGYGGVQFRYNLPMNIDVHIEPGALLIKSSVLPKTHDFNHSAVISARMMVGASYRF
ncbi:MAG: hypothetical protein K2M49_01965 [Muribaculaceae bacterium]|nr:hypothetical protein [Muribaculaceae bacterium]